MSIATCNDWVVIWLVILVMLVIGIFISCIVWTYIYDTHENEPFCLLGRTWRIKKTGSNFGGQTYWARTSEVTNTWCSGNFKGMELTSDRKRTGTFRMNITVILKVWLSADRLYHLPWMIRHLCRAYMY